MRQTNLCAGGRDHEYMNSIQDCWYVDSGLRRLLLRLDQLAVDQHFGDLDGIERRALAQVVKRKQSTTLRRYLRSRYGTFEVLTLAFNLYFFASAETIELARSESAQGPMIISLTRFKYSTVE